jgi:hypothetical protein
MELIEIIFNYRGALIEVQIHPENDFRGFLYPVDINGQYAFTLTFDDDDEWTIMRESNGLVPQVEDELFGMILKQLKWELNHAA